MSEEIEQIPLEASVSEHDQMYDLANRCGRSVIAVVDALTQRGAFRGEELTTIGQLRDQAMQMVQLAEIYHSDS